MTHRRPLLALTLLVLAVLLAQSDLTGFRKPARSTAAAAADLPAPPFSARWIARGHLDLEAIDYGSFADTINRRLYLNSMDGGLTVYNSDTQQVVGRIDYWFNARYFTPGHERLYLASPAQTGPDPDGSYLIRVLNPLTLAVLKTVTYRCAAAQGSCGMGDLAEGPGGRLYIAHQGKGVFDVVDGATGAILRSVTVNNQQFGGTPALVTYGDRLYVAAYFDDTEINGIAVYDISAEAPVRVDFVATPERGISVMDISPDGAFLTATDTNFLLQLRADTLATLWTHDCAYVAGHYPDGDLLLDEYNLESGAPDLIIVRDAATGAGVRGSSEADSEGHQPYDLILPIGDEGVAVYDHNGLELRRPVDYAAALPMAYADACPAGPFHDTFDDPASGWPTRLTERFAYEYIPGAYHIVLRQPMWTAVSRGDTWDRAAYMQVYTWVSPTLEGTVGIVYGLNDDWTEFYSYEIYPAENLLVLFHFYDEAWHVLHVAQTYVLDDESPTWLGISRDANTGNPILTRGGQPVGGVPEFTGRIALAFSSFEGPARAVFDEYEFTGRNCWRAPLRAASVEFAPDLPPRPPLDELLSR